MQKLMATLVFVALTTFASAQTGEVKTEQRVKARTHVSKETQAPRQSRELRNEFRGQADVNVNERVNRPDVNMSNRTDRESRERPNVNVNVRERENIEGRGERPATVEQTRVTTHTEQRAENRGGKFFFRDREIRRHEGFDRNDWHFRIGRHDRDWYLQRYEVVFVEGCWYYIDGPYLYPAYGFDPNCDYPDQFIVFEF